ncbi:GntR family transcriptional regulator [Shinella sp.]|uniref:GntR family transcriptional regulator n=1 Tax=Shinella sp. TaxID=1870904 RepID=UPI003F714531
MGTVKQEEPSVPVIQRHSVANQVYFDLRNRILSGQIPQGERLVEATIARSLGISRAPVREAVNRLMEAGLLENRTHFGPSVVQMSTEKIRELYAVRNSIESLAIQSVTKRHSKDDIAELRLLIKVMSDRAEENDLPGVVEAELVFHEALWRMADNPYIQKIAGLLFDHMRLALTIDNAAYGSLVDVAREHEPLVEAIETGNPDKATEALTRHIMSSLETISRS